MTTIENCPSYGTSELARMYTLSLLYCPDCNLSFAWGTHS